MTVAERIENLPNLQYAISKGENDAMVELKDLYRAVLGKTMQRDCYSCRIRAYTEIINSKNMANQKFKFKDNDAMVYFGHQHFTSANLTDDVAQAMVDANPSNAELFHPAPEQTAKKVKADKADKPVKADKAEATEQSNSGEADTV